MIGTLVNSCSSYSVLCCYWLADRKSIRHIKYPDPNHSQKDTVAYLVELQSYHMGRSILAVLLATILTISDFSCVL